MSRFEPAYLALHRSGELARRAERAETALSECRLCGWDCGIDRRSELGPCRTGMEAVVASAYLHFGEEKPLVIGGGSGAIFFAFCDLRCQFCQTARWNIRGQGRKLTTRQLANLMLKLQGQGASNINLVTPTHVAAQIVMALSSAADDGLQIPLVWNSGGYDSLWTLRLLDGLVDIYLPDMKYADPQVGRSLSGIPDYPAVNQRAVAEMFQQVGHLALDGEGRARRGMLVRHLVMPGMAQQTEAILRWIVEHLGQDTYLSLMDQYRPAYRAFGRPDISQPLTADEYRQMRRFARSLGLRRLDDTLTLIPTLSQQEEQHD